MENEPRGMERFHELNAEWGRQLLLDYPEGLGDEPDWNEDGNARFIWAAKGYSYEVKKMGALRAVWNIDVAGSKYEDFHAIPVEHLTELARRTFKLASVYWRNAKMEADRLANARAEQVTVQLAYDKDYREFAELLSQSTSIREMELTRLELLDEHENAQNLGDIEKTRHIERKMSVLDERLIERDRVERRRGKIGYVVGSIGTVVTVIALGLTVWSMRDSREPDISNPPLEQPAQPAGVQ